jgi:hypothetical protein
LCANERERRFWGERASVGVGGVGAVVVGVVVA